MKLAQLPSQCRSIRLQELVTVFTIENVPRPLSRFYCTPFFNPTAASAEINPLLERKLTMSSKELGLAINPVATSNTTISRYNDVDRNAVKKEEMEERVDVQMT